MIPSEPGVQLIEKDTVKIAVVGKRNDDAQENGLQRIVEFFRRYGHVAPGIQLGHAGRKASTRRPLLGEPAGPLDPGGWQSLAPSAIAFEPDWPVPRTMDQDDLDRMRAFRRVLATRCISPGWCGKLRACPPSPWV